MQTPDDIIAFIQADAWLMALLCAVQSINEPDCWLAAGAIRNPIWAKLHGVKFDPNNENDVDVIYFDPSDILGEKESEYETALRHVVPGANWEVRNQARMHLRNGDSPYINCSQALEYWAETPTAIGARLTSGEIELLAPYGIDDLLGLILRPTPKFKHKRHIYEARIAEKAWHAKWPLLTIL